MRSLNTGGRLLVLDTPKIMGILNVTPDSFYAGSRFMSTSDALKRVETLLAEGADILDIGAYSSRPGAAALTASEESDRLIPIVRAITQRFPDAIVSVDTFRAEVAREAVNAGAHIVNDISGGTLDPLID